MKDVSLQTSALRPLTSGLETNRGQATRGVQDSAFAEKLNALRGVMTPQMPAQSQGVTLPQGLKFSNHAIDRMQSRGIRFSPEQLGKIENAVAKAASKGAKNTLLLTDESALIVSIKDKNVVTVMDKANLKENVFTNIDSTVVI
jgi:flagellar operon protein